MKTLWPGAGTWPSTATSRDSSTWSGITASSVVHKYFTQMKVVVSLWSRARFYVYKDFLVDLVIKAHVLLIFDFFLNYTVYLGELRKEGQKLVNCGLRSSLPNNRVIWNIEKKSYSFKTSAVDPNTVHSIWIRIRKCAPNAKLDLFLKIYKNNGTWKKF